MPFQPDGIWRSPYNGDVWKMSEGPDQYRRALYTFWKRTAPYPSMITFDGASRAVCVTRRIRTNTPLQALTTLNDSAFFVFARSFALRMQKSGSKEIAKQIENGYEYLMYKTITAPKLDALIRLYGKAFESFKLDKKAAAAITGEKEEEVLPETAALTVVANAMLNMDEWVSKN